ncbi:hypothetical protein [Paenibacillus eucommiae]|uniref:Transposase n=1 Tax=Paenibacillus eucommiae TaxID=1355755 RepID=A0ABS4J0X0_9BACL|nr:hypothetical protein [Paenibacillus eucommiae]MBP1993483.1 hypothetical protein [Paenibacillus eucommiae]
MNEEFLEQADKDQEGFIEEDRDDYTDLATVESQRNDLAAEEFPEGPYGSSQLTESLGKSTPWRRDQRPPNRFVYENRELHEGLERVYPGDHKTHDETENE